MLSFFTGAGLLDLGIHNAGFDVIWRNEYYQPFVEGFKHGFSRVFNAKPNDFPVCNKSIEEITPYSIRREAFTGKVWPKEFGVIGGPPCPDFSAGGKNKGSSGDNGKLTGVFFDHVAGLQPTFFIFENVKGILKTKKHREYLVSQIKKLSNSYLFDLKLLNSLNFGVPQDRERVILIGFHLDYLTDILPLSKIFEVKKTNNKCLDELMKSPKIIDLDTGKRRNKRTDETLRDCQWFPWPKSDKFDDAKNKYSWPTISPFGECAERPDDIPLELCVGHYMEKIQHLENQEDYFQPISDKFKTVAEGDVSRKSFKRLHRWRYSPTAAYGNNEVHLHPYKARRLSAREAMRLQTIPDEYVLPDDMTLSDKFKTIGNGVPVKLGSVIADAVWKVFSEERIAIGK